MLYPPSLYGFPNLYIQIYTLIFIYTLGFPNYVTISRIATPQNPNPQIYHVAILEMATPKIDSHSKPISTDA